MTKVQINTFAVLKDYFQPQFEINIPYPTVENLINTLKEINPSAENILKSSRIAVKENFVSYDYKLNENDKIFLLPPSSGG